MALTMKPSWVFALLGFAAGTAFGAFAVRDLEPRVGETATEPSNLALAPDPEPGKPQGTQPPAAHSATDRGTPLTDTGSGGEPSVVDDPRIDSALALWRSAVSQITDLQTRLANVERVLAKRGEPEETLQYRAPETPEQQRDSLVAAGVNPDLAEDLVWRESRIELDRLHLRDQAAREGWLETERYLEAVNRLSKEGGSLREQIGDPAWDRYLYLTGEDNRLSIASVIPGSAAEVAGFQSGDLIETYAGEQPFGFNELRRATSAGERGELVLVRIRRGDRVFDTWVPRGPLGVRLGMTRVEPLP